jgi:hypothetical protein
VLEALMFKLQFEVRRCHLNVTHHVFYDDYSARRISPADVISHVPLQLVMIEKSKTEVYTNNGLSPSVLSGSVSHSSSDDRGVP